MFIIQYIYVIITIWAGHVVRMGEERGVYRVLVGKPEGKRPLGRPRRRWVDNIRIDLREMGCGYMDWIGLAQDRDRWRTHVSAVMNLRVPQHHVYRLPHYVTYDAHPASCTLNNVFPHNMTCCHNTMFTQSLIT